MGVCCVICVSSGVLVLKKNNHCCCKFGVLGFPGISNCWSLKSVSASFFAQQHKLFDNYLPFGAVDRAAFSCKAHPVNLYKCTILTLLYILPVSAVLGRFCILPAHTVVNSSLLHLLCISSFTLNLQLCLSLKTPHVCVIYAISLFPGDSSGGGLTSHSSEFSLSFTADLIRQPWWLVKLKLQDITRSQRVSHA